MFLPVEIHSVNSPAQLPPGEYVATCLIYVAPDGHSRLIEYRYTRNGLDYPEACDLLFIDGSGRTRMCDFLRMPDRSWRDSFGTRADYLPALLPPEMSGYQLVAGHDLDSLMVGRSE